MCAVHYHLELDRPTNVDLHFSSFEAAKSLSFKSFLELLFSGMQNSGLLRYRLFHHPHVGLF